MSTILTRASASMIPKDEKTNFLYLTIVAIIAIVAIFGVFMFSVKGEGGRATSVDLTLLEADDLIGGALSEVKCEYYQNKYYNELYNRNALFTRAWDKYCAKYYAD